MPLLNYTTKVNAQKTVTEVMGFLVAKGAYQVDSASDCTAFCKIIDEPFHTICCLVMHRERLYQTTKMVHGGGEVPKRNIALQGQCHCIVSHFVPSATLLRDLQKCP